MPDTCKAKGKILLGNGFSEATVECNIVDDGSGEHPEFHEADETLACDNGYPLQQVTYRWREPKKPA